MSKHEKLDYVEFAACDLSASKSFFTAVFGWEFQDYGDEYSAFSSQGLNGGFYQADLSSVSAQGGALLVFYSSNIQETYQKVIAHNGKVIREVFDFPGGCRFHFLEPSGNEFAVWSESK
ncbi:glyoxalase [Vibrio sp. 10N.286.49.C2]|uniref:VOC family protein n=1 Tax=unclassified Vibrio TaxID=2614977 RepID=UPI000C846F4B|nr:MULTISPECIES: VOC family protein [unclassified Vibrio]PMH37267.1 glyoxalase [Vibrio sp. 10N.286.49.C2]PMH57412.1 glyoxalase [Vibrio sp. 10N.286.49.B1]PMH80727.1 glyoxalase [Vibrio sp. 10N.286.48.B7]